MWTFELQITPGNLSLMKAKRAGWSYSIDVFAYEGRSHLVGLKLMLGFLLNPL